MKTTAKFLAVLLAVATLTGVIFAVAMSSSWGKEVVHKVLVDQLNQDQLTRVSIGSVDAVSLLSPPGALTLEASSIEVRTAEEQTVVAIGELSGKVWLAPLLWRKFSVPRLELHGVELLANDQGHPLAAGVLSGGGFKKRNFDVEVDQLVVGSLFLIAHDRGKRVLGRLSGELDVVAPADNPRVVINLKSASGTLSKPHEIEVVEASGVVDTGNRTVATIDFEALTDRAALIGRLEYTPTASKPIRTAIQSVRTRDGGTMLDMMMPSLENIMKLPTLGR